MYATGLGKWQSLKMVTWSICDLTSLTSLRLEV